MYRHTQIGWFLVLLNAALGVLFAVQLARGASRGLLVGLVVVLLVGVLFGALTIEVSRERLSFRFGPGGWGKSLALRDVADVAPARSRWLEGIGIRVTGRGMLYNVAVGSAVEITLRSGTRFRLGTDEPERLARAILDARGIADAHPAPAARD